MKGYKRLFKLDLSSKTIENSYKVLNRQIWTNQKEFWKTSAKVRKAVISALCVGGLKIPCTFCSNVQNTQN